MIRVPDLGRFELRLMDGSTNPYLLQAGSNNSWHRWYGKKT